jgi:hypothetical protein
MRRYIMAAARVCLIVLTAAVIWQLPERAGTGFLGSSLDESGYAVYYEYKYILWPVLTVTALWIAYLLIARLKRPRSPVS